MTPPIISSGEAFLIGMCLEEYLQTKSFRAGTYFVDFIQTRLGPFVPFIWLPQDWKILPPDEVPSDINWYVGEYEYQYGSAPSRPHAYFAKTETDVLERLWDPKDGSLIHSLLVYLDAGVAKSAYDRVWFPSAKGPEVGKAWAEYLHVFSEVDEQRQNDFSRRTTSDDVQAIEEKLETLVEEHGHESAFMCGRCFGRLLADCQRFELDIYQYIWSGPGYPIYLRKTHGFTGNPEEFLLSTDQFFDRFQEGVKELSQHDATRKCHYALAVLETNNSSASVEPLLSADPDFDWHEDWARLARARATLWLAIGEVLSRLEGVPAPFQKPRHRCVLFVEGHTDKVYLETAARLANRQDLLKGLEIRASHGARSAALEAEILRRSFGDAQIQIAVLLDWDESGKSARDMLQNNFRWRGGHGGRVLTYRQWRRAEPSTVKIEAEDMFPATYVRNFVASQPTDFLADMDRLHDGTFHYGFTEPGKTAFLRYVEDTLRKEDTDLWITILEEVRKRLGLRR